MKNFFVVLMLLVLLSVLSACGIKNMNTTTNDLFGAGIKSVKQVKGIEGEAIELTDSSQKDNLLESLMVEKWEVENKWNMKLMPDLFLIIDDKTIGFFSSEKNHIKVETTGKTTYYRVPDGVYENILSFFP